MIRKLLISSAIAGAAIASPASAAKFMFTSTAFDLTFELPDSNPDNGFPGQFFYSPGTTGTLNGSAFEFQSLTFFSADYDLTPGFSGGFSYDNTYAAIFSGLQLYSGTEAAPRFVAGTYALTQFGSGTAGTLTISDVADVSAVPEPMTWALMVGGFGMVGGAMRRNGKVAVART
ncbi:PEPxxWA-CTERM sorting domain-containing protein [Sphingosinicellaceae bacterium]|nr:PEPxxWA-CTERM sorting domain-containing protein [Sphingosinicellaceae bacterium]